MGQFGCAVPVLTVVMPTFNEVGCIQEAVEDVERNVLAYVQDAELVIVDDGSQDGTADVLNHLAEVHPWLKVLHQPNHGHGPALRAGVLAATGDWVLLVDSDMEIALDGFRSAWERHGAVDAILGVRKDRESPLDRTLVTVTLRLLLRVLVGGWTKDANCPFKLVRRGLIQLEFGALPCDYVIPSAFLASVLVKKGATIEWRDVGYHFRRTGAVSLKRGKLARVALTACLQTASVAAAARTRH
ncbi:MAG: glycosyltransferase family 2 protein [Candidatus Dormibacteria bacterium]